jgi:hypothetical protein
MRRGLARSIVVALVLLVIGLSVAGGYVASRNTLSHTLARARWQSEAIRHYRFEARWISGGYNAHALLEARDGQLVAGTNLLTGQPMDPIELGMLSHMFPVERMFDEIAALERWPQGWRGKVARLLPPFARRIEPCLVPLPRIRYDARLGYPTELRAYTNPCFNGVGYRARIERLTPLP